MVHKILHITRTHSVNIREILFFFSRLSISHSKHIISNDVRAASIDRSNLNEKVKRILGVAIFVDRYVLYM